MNKIGLVLEGGAMRVLYTAGVLDTFMEYNILVDGAISVSAGALFGVNYFSNQNGRVLRYNKKYCNDKRYISIKSLIKTGNIVNKDFAYYKVTNELDKFNDSEFRKNNKDYYVTITNVLTGMPEYINIKNGVLDNLEVLRATSAMPFVSKMVSINGNKYLDGALGDSIPVNKCLELGYDKVIVILTRPIDYRKKKCSILKSLFIDIKYYKYPNLRKSIKERYKNYNDTLDNVIKMEKEGKIFVIRPSKKLDIKRLERNKDKLQSVYDLGVSDTLDILDKLKEYLSK